MKNIMKYLAVTAVCTIGFAFNHEALKQLDLSEQEANAAIRDNFIRGECWFPDKKAIKSLVVAKRATTVKELGSYIRRYIESAEFNKAYQQAREAARPAGKGGVQTLISERLTAIEQELSEAEEKLKTAHGDTKKLYELSISQLKQERDALKNTSHPMHKDYVENLTEETEEHAEQNKMEGENFDNDYPPTVKELVKLRLQTFLKITATLDFNAKLVQQGRFKVFADPALEAKDGDWKKLFRAGPETIGAARQFAQQWLQDLNK